MEREQHIFCDHCNILSEYDIKQVRETFPVKGEDIEIESNVAFCKKCDTELFCPELDDENLQRAYDVYRQKHNLLSPQDIKSLRESYKLSQRLFARLLGWGEITIHRYENGAIPDEVHNTLLEFLKSPSNMNVILEQRKDHLKAREFERIKSIVEDRLNQKKHSSLLDCLVEIKDLNQADSTTGYRSFDFHKFANMVVFFATKEATLFKTKLMKLLWYADMFYFKKYTQSISGLKYVHLPYGPVPESHEILLSILQEEGYIELSAIPIGSFMGEIVLSKSEIETDILESDELENLEEVYNKFKSYSAREISERSHEEKGYMETNARDAIDYNYADHINLN